MILRVDNVDDPRLEPYGHVGDHRWLRSQGLFVAEGRLVLERLLAAGSYEIQSALVSPAACAALGDDLRALDAPVYLAPQPVLKAIAGFDFHRGCLAVARRPSPLSLEIVHGAPLLLGLEAIGNPDNVGGLFRTAVAFGVDAVLLDEATGDPLYRKAIRTSMGAVLRMPYVEIGRWPDAVGTLRGSGFRVLALTPHASATPLDAFVARRSSGEGMLVLVGAEGSGLSGDVLGGADARVRIPIAGGVDSLNVVVAAGIALSRLGGENRVRDQEDRTRG